MAKNEAIKADTGAGVDYYSPVNESVAVHGSDRFELYSTYENFIILKEVGAKNAMVQYKEIKKDCKCASEVLYGSATTNVDGEFVVGANYKMTVVRYSRTVCDRPTWTKDADNEVTFIINCGDDNSAPGDGVVDISYGYHDVGGYVNR